MPPHSQSMHTTCAIATISWMSRSISLPFAKAEESEQPTTLYPKGEIRRPEVNIRRSGPHRCKWRVQKIHVASVKGIAALPYSHDGSPTTRPCQVVRAAKIIDALPKVPRRCGSNSPSLPMLRTPRQDAWGCPEARKSTCKDTFGDISLQFTNMYLFLPGHPCSFLSAR